MTHVVDARVAGSRSGLLLASLLHTDPVTLGATDQIKTEFSTPDGMLINAYDDSVEHGARSVMLALDYDAEQDWVFADTYAGKEINSRVSGDQNIVSMLGQMQRSRAFLAGPQDGPLSFPVWMSDADPSVVHVATIALTERGNHRHKAVQTVGPLSLNVVLDDNGSTVDGSISSGANTVRMRRVLVEGGLPGADD